MKIIVLFITMFMFPAYAEIYKWIDEDGNVHFGDRPVDVDSATEINIRTSNQTGFKNSSGNKKERDYLLKKIEKDKQEDEERRKKKAKKDEKHLRLCKRYKSRLQVHIQTNRTYTMSPDGERTYYSDKQRATKKKNIEKGVSKYCH